MPSPKENKMKKIKLKNLKCLVSMLLCLCMVFCFVGCQNPSGEGGNEGATDGGNGESRFDYLSQLQKDYDFDFVSRFMDELLQKLEEEEKPYEPQPYPTGVDIGDTLYKGNAIYDFFTIDKNGNTGRDGTKGWYTAQKIAGSKLPTLVQNGDDKHLEFTEAAQIELFYLRTSDKQTFHIFDNKTAWSNATAQKELFKQEFLFEFTVSANGPFVLGISDFRTVTSSFLDTSDLYGINFLFDGNTIKMSRYSSGLVEVVGTMPEGFNFGDGNKHVITFAMTRTDTDNGTIRMFIDKEQVELKATEDYGYNPNHTTYGGGKVKKGVIYLSDASAYGQRFSVVPQVKDGVKTTVNIHDYNRVWVGKSELPWTDDVVVDTFDPTKYPTGASYGSWLTKGTTMYNFWDIDSAGNTGRDGTKGWYTAKVITDSALPSLKNIGTADQYLEFTKAAQIELFHLEGTGATYHAFDNKKAWGVADAAKLFGQEFVYELTVSATDSFILGLTDFGQSTATFMDKTTSGSLYGIQFLFEGNTIKMSRYSSGKLEASATLDSSVNFADGKERKISFCITREDLDNGRIRVFVDEKLCVFTATADYGLANKDKAGTGEVKDGVLYLSDAYLYGQRFTVVPQNSGKVNICDFNRIKVDASQDDLPDFPDDDQSTQYTVTLTGGLKFADGSTTVALEEGKVIPEIKRDGSFSSVYDKLTNTVLVFDNVTGEAIMPAANLELAPYVVKTGDVSYGFTNGGTMAITGKYVVDQFNTNEAVNSSSGNTGDIIVTNHYPIKDTNGETRLGSRFTYNSAIPVGKNIRIKTAYGIDANETYIATYTIHNYSTNPVKFKLYQVNSGRTLSYGGKSFVLDVSLASGESFVGTFEFNFADNKANTNILHLIVFEEEQKNFDIGLISNVIKKSDVTYSDDYEQKLEQLATVLKDKNVSVIGDSISTYRGYNNGDAADTTNSTIRNNADCYKDSWKGGSVTPKDTWWYQAIEQTNMNLLVNNAWSGDNVASSRFENGCVNLHDNTGNASDINPDIIFCYIGINNHSAGTTVEEFKAAYDKVIKLMKEKYAGADIFIFTLPQHYGVNNEAKVALLDSYNAAIRELAASNGCYVVDLAAESGITRANSINYTTDNLHPNLIGMDVITKVVIEELMKKYLA